MRHHDEALVYTFKSLIYSLEAASHELFQLPDCELASTLPGEQPPTHCPFCFQGLFKTLLNTLNDAFNVMEWLLQLLSSHKYLTNPVL